MLSSLWHHAEDVSQLRPNPRGVTLFISKHASGHPTIGWCWGSVESEICRPWGGGRKMLISFPQFMISVCIQQDWILANSLILLTQKKLQFLIFGSLL